MEGGKAEARGGWEGWGNKGNNIGRNGSYLTWLATS